VRLERIGNRPRIPASPDSRLVWPTRTRQQSHFRGKRS